MGEGRVTRHHGPVRNIGGETPLDQKMEPIEAHSQIELSVIRNTDFEAFALFMKDMADDMLKGMSSGFFKNLNEIFDHSRDRSNTNAENEETVTWDELLDQLEKTEIAFDDKGQPILPKLMDFTRHQASYLHRTKSAQYEQRFWQIIGSKRNQSNAEKSSE